MEGGAGFLASPRCAHVTRLVARSVGHKVKFAINCVSGPAGTSKERFSKMSSREAHARGKNYQSPHRRRLHFGNKKGRLKRVALLL